MVYGADAMILVEIKSPTWRRTNFNVELNQEGLKNIVNLVEEVRAVTQVKEIGAK